MITNYALDKTLSIFLFVHLYMQKAHRVFIRTYGNVPLIFVLIYCSTPNPSFKLLNTDFSGAFQPHFRLLCPFVKLTYLHTILIYTQIVALEHRKFGQGSSLLTVIGAKWQRPQVRGHKATWNKHWEPRMKNILLF